MQGIRPMMATEPTLSDAEFQHARTSLLELMNFCYKIVVSIASLLG